MLQSFKNSFIVDLFPIYFLTFSKKANSSAVALLDDVGGSGSGMTGVNVGSMDSTSAPSGLWVILGRLLLFTTPGAGLEAGAGLSTVNGTATGVVTAGCLSLRGRFLLSLLALAGGAKLPTGGIF